jgi:hypothetical protein
MAHLDRQKLYDRVEDFFDLNGNAGMKLTREAAIRLCLATAAKELVVVKLEGGIWRSGQFEARLDAIWDGLDPPLDQETTEENNLNAANFIRSAIGSVNAFIVTCAPAGGYKPKLQPRLQREHVGNS